ncbi:MULTISPECIES: hypothetical protein [unclassified Dysgonomonas]|uniref:hypothetical protein n=1 Tax=unclassified Dysgonomonas TaxID=2630389 RepID=UPI00247539D2|nr:MULTISPECIES: hypothetical protein [unclassified Dysgonomonas]
MKPFFLFLIIVLFLSGCSQVHTDNPQKVFRYWTHIPLPNSRVEVLKGRYWQSGHFTSEYEAYLLIVAPEEWRNELIELNGLFVDTATWYCPKDVPDWFSPPGTFIQYQSPHNSQFRFWMQQNADTIYIYDLQL